MSDYIYGNSLRAAKSKANYLFEGDFRRRPNQNLSGASRSLARGELLQQAAVQRQSREDTRRKENASVKIQSVWRAYRCRKLLAASMRSKFDTLIRMILESAQPSTGFTSEHFQQLGGKFFIFYHSRHDGERFNCLIDLMMHNYRVVLQSKQQDPARWLHIITRLLSLSLAIAERNVSNITEKRCIDFLEYFTRPGDVLVETEDHYVWQSLIKCRFYSVIRQLSDRNNQLNVTGCSLDLTNKLYLELIRRSLNIRVDESQKNKTNMVYCFFEQFLCWPLQTSLENYYVDKLLEQCPRLLKPKHILNAFNLHLVSNSGRPTLKLVNFENDLNCRNITWLCFLFVRTLFNRLDELSDDDKIIYMLVLRNYIGPAEYVTNMSSMLSENDMVDDQIADEDDTPGARDGPTMASHIADTHLIITRLITLINHVDHINSLRNLLGQTSALESIVPICNLMLSHENLAIFNCRLLYTVAFSKELSRCLWQVIIRQETMSLYNREQIYKLISRGSTMISHDCWNTILPRLRIFCSLSSYLLPTLGDDEFYTSDDSQIFIDSSKQAQTVVEATNSSLTNNQSSTVSIIKKEPNNSISSFYIDRELIGISAILRDICVGMVEILYQFNRQAANQRHASFNSSAGIGVSIQRASGVLNDHSSKLLRFEIKSCFQAIARLVCQLHARDSRKKFCPEGHWICPTVIVPANKAIDFQLVTSQRGRLLNQITRDDPSIDRLASASSEIKTVLILQEIPFVISFHDRVQIFHQLLRKERQIHQSEGYHFNLPGTAISVQIRRNYIYEDAFEKLSFDNEPNMKLPLKVSLVNTVGADEAGIDGGGLTKEFLDELLKAGFDPMRGFFKYTKDHFLYPNPSANVLFSNLLEGFEVHYEFLGRMLGKAIFEKLMVELPMATFFLAKLLAVKHSSDVDLHNLESLDPVLYKNLVYLKNYKGDVADLNLDFTISNNELDEHEVVELKPGGSKIPVTHENKIEYVHLVADYRLNKQIRLQCAAFKRGMAQLVDLDWLRMFDSRELQILISGAPTKIDVSDWRRHTLYGNGYSDDSEPVNIFWSVVNRFDENQKRKLLKFATSCSLPPLLGFKDLVPQFAIAPAEEERLPTASTCMNLLKLPQCEDEETMRSKLLYAIESNSGFELS